MKNTKIKKELKELSAEQLKGRLNVLRQELFSLRVNATTTHVKDYSQFKKMQKDVARALTFLQQKERATQAQTQA